MGWAVTLEGRSDRRGIVVLIDDRAKAEHIASEIRTQGQRVVVTPYAEPGTEAPPLASERSAS